MKKIILVALLLALFGVGGFLTLQWMERRHQEPLALLLHGNVELRQISLPFNNAERITDVLVDEGDLVKKGQVLARLDTSRLLPQLAQAEAKMEAQRQVVEKYQNGYRPEEIAQARANLDAAKAASVDAKARNERYVALVDSGSISRQEADNAKAAADSAIAQQLVREKELELLLAGFRVEEIAETKAILLGYEAQVALLRQQITDTELFAPRDAVVRSRLMEPGEMSSPQKPVFMLAITDPKWVRAYVSETDLGKVKPGMKVAVTMDSFPDRRIAGQIGFISSVAEFTPKTLQSEELRTSLVYEVRIWVTDTDDILRLGMPVSVRFSPAAQN